MRARTNTLVPCQNLPRGLRQFVAKPWGGGCQTVSAPAGKFFKIRIGRRHAGASADMIRDAEPLPLKARIYIGLTALLGISVLAMACANWESPDLFEYGGFLLVAIGSSGMRISVPGITGTLSLTFLFVLFGIAELTTSETLLLG